MNRRGFMQIASAALASIPLAGSALAKPAPKIGTTWGGLVTSPEFGKVGAYFDLRPRPIIKVTGIWKPHGFESAPQECQINESSYIELPDIRHPRTTYRSALARVLPDKYRIYAPLHGFEQTGPWYFLREVSFRDAKRARFTVALEYQDGDLICQLAPEKCDVMGCENPGHPVRREVLCFHHSGTLVCYGPPDEK